jgi:hypothetical protein
MITETQHQSNLILISQEKCAEMECLDEELYSIKCLELLGLTVRFLRFARNDIFPFPLWLHKS